MQWEYKTIKFDAVGFWLSQGQVDEKKLDAAMNQLGSDGLGTGHGVRHQSRRRRNAG